MPGFFSPVATAEFFVPELESVAAFEDTAADKCIHYIDRHPVTWSGLRDNNEFAWNLRAAPFQQLLKLGTWQFSRVRVEVGDFVRKTCVKTDIVAVEAAEHNQQVILIFNVSSYQRNGDGDVMVQIEAGDSE